FTQMVLKSMRDATPRTEASPSGDTFTAMLDARFSQQLSGRPGGLAEMLEKQLTRHMRNLPEPAPENLPQAAPAQAAPATVAAEAPAAPKSRAAAFLEKMLPHAQAAERQTGVPASFILGQAALESGWGKGEIRNADGSNSF